MIKILSYLALCALLLGCRARGSSSLNKDKKEEPKGGGKDGNSGDIVACNWDDPATRKVWFLDYYEALNDPQPMSPIVPLQPQELVNIHPTKYQNVAQALINRLKNVDPYRQELYTGFIASFDEDSYHGDNLRMPDLPDRGPSLVAIPKNCDVIITAFQQSPQKVTNQKTSAQTRLLIEKRYIIEKKYWDALDDFNKGVLIAHEVFYREARAYGFRLSKLVRLFSGFSLRNSYPALVDRKEFAQTLIQDYGLPAVIPAKEYNGAYETPSIEYYPSGNLSSAVITKIPDLRLVESGSSAEDIASHWSTQIVVGSSTNLVPGGMKISFFENNAVSSLEDPREYNQFQTDIGPSEAIYGTERPLGLGRQGRQFDIGSCHFETGTGYNVRIRKIQFNRVGLTTAIEIQGEDKPADWCKDARDVQTSYDLPTKTFRIWASP